MDLFRKQFKTGDVEHGEYKYTGINIVVHPCEDKGDLHVSMDQKFYAKMIETIKVDENRSTQPDLPLTKKEMSEARSVAGCAQWLQTQTRPDIAFETSAASGELGNDTKVGTLQREASLTLPNLRDHVKRFIHIKTCAPSWHSLVARDRIM